MPARFSFWRFSEVWVAWSHPEILGEASGEVRLVGRVADGWRPEQAVEFTWPVFLAVREARTPSDSLSVSSRKSLFGMQLVPEQLANTIIAMMALVLVAACLNLATLYLARLRRTAPDYATRQALGAGPAGVIRHLLTEIIIIVAAGGVAAALATVWLTRYLDDRMDGVLLSWVEIRLDGRGFAVLLVTLAVVLALVALPAVRLVRRLDLARLLTHKGVLGGTPKHGRGASALIATQVAVVVILAAAALPIALSAIRLGQVQSGIAADRIVELDVTMTSRAYEGDAARDTYARRVRDALAAEPQVAGVSRTGLMVGWRYGATGTSDSIYTDAGSEPLPRGRGFRLSTQVVDPGYFAMVGLSFVAGHGFEPGLAGDGERVAVLSAEVARRFFPDQPAVGRRFRRGTTEPWVRVVGVVGDQMQVWEEWSGTTVEPDPVIYVSDQQALPVGMRFHVRAGTMSPSFIPAVRAAVERVDTTQPVARVRLLADIFALHRETRQWIAVVLGSGAAAVVLLAMTGVVGLVSYYTTARLPELALRVALGGPLQKVAWLVARGTLRSVGIGLACGALTLALIQDGIRRFTYETTTLSPLTLALIGGAVLVVASAALLVPLRRLRRVSPQELLRTE